MLIPQETKSRSEPPSSEESTHYSCEDDDVLLTEEQKYKFFQILRVLLEERGSLKDGKKRKVQHDGKILKLMYMTEGCEIIIQDFYGHFQFKEVVSTEDIYLRWRGNENAEPLSVENLQNVRNELRFLKILNERGDACFSKAINEFVEEFEYVQKNTTLKLICDDIILTFVSGKGTNMATVTYDDCEEKPKYTMKVECWIMFWRVLYLDFPKIREWIDILKDLHALFTPLLNFISDWFHSWKKHQQTQ